MTVWSESIRVSVSWEWLKTATPLSLKIRLAALPFALREPHSSNLLEKVTFHCAVQGPLWLLPF